MEYCAHCRAIRPTRKSSRKRTIRQPDGTVKMMVVDSFHCSRCNHFVGSVEREVSPAPAASDERAAAPGEAPAVDAEEAEAAGVAGTSPSE
jgi:hypothetical protein